jgi:hypothetical protein
MIMRKILLLTVLIIGYYLPTFSQFNSRFKFDSTFNNFSFSNSTKTFRHVDSIDFKGLLNKSTNDNGFLFPKLVDKNMTFGRDSVGIFNTQKTFDNMPCLKPQGFFPMPIYKPDSTVRYTLLIKKYK